jgi:ferritin-like metal-binding protein YciE
MEAANAASIIAKDKIKKMKKNNHGWEQLLFYDIRRLEATEEEIKGLLPDLLTKTRSLRLMTILQKYLIFIDDGINKLNTIIKEGGIGVLLQANSAITIVWRDTKEKLHYCNSEPETDHCIVTSLMQMAAIKIYQCQQAALLSEKLGHSTIKNLLLTVIDNEQRILKWLTELQEKEKIEQEESSTGQSLLRQAYWIL